VLLADVNVFLYAHRPESARHDEYRGWLETALTGLEPFGASELVLSSFLRIATHHRVYRAPTPVDVALDFCRVVVTAPAAVRVRPGPDHWALFTGLVATAGARGNLVPDAYLAALALEHAPTWVTTDRGFARYPQLRWTTPLA
jgi:toxin-antitoxin system PIN domain toxin